jgi:hypothetical protein
MKKRRRAKPKESGQSVSFTRDGDTVELVRGSIKMLNIQPGDLVVVRIDGRGTPSILRNVLKTITGLITAEGKEATAVVMPADYTFDLIPHATAVELLQSIVNQKVVSSD